MFFVFFLFDVSIAVYIHSPSYLCLLLTDTVYMTCEHAYILLTADMVPTAGKAEQLAA